MGAHSGINIDTNGLTFLLDPASAYNWTNINSNNYITNGFFAEGLDATPSGGHNAQNDIVVLNNPGNSNYVLKQTMGINQTEYEMQPPIPSSFSSSPICMSGWYAQSSDYTGGGRMFHSRAFSSSGAHISLGTGIGTELYNIDIDDINWSYRYAVLTTPSDYTGSFSWYCGYAGTAYTGARYYTNLKAEVGNIPNLVDLCNNYHPSNTFCGYNVADRTIDFNNSNSIDLPNSLGYQNSVSVFAWYKSTGTPAGGYHIICGGAELEISIPTAGQIRTGVYTSARYVSNHGSGLTDGNWHHIGFTYNNLTKTSYIDGVNVGTQNTNGSALASSFGNRKLGRYGSSTTYYANGELGSFAVYNRALTDAEVKNNYENTKSRFGY